MGKKKKKKLLKLLKQSKSAKQLGKSLTLQQLHDQYVAPELKANNRKHSTVTSLERHVKRFETWWSSLSKKPLPIEDITRKHLEMYRTALAEQGNSVPLRNSAVAAVIQCLQVAVGHQFIAQSPKLKALSHRPVAPKIYPSHDAICKIWDACDHAKWPRRDYLRDLYPYSPATAWRVAIVMYWTYGFRTQELIQLEARFRPLTWSNIHAPGLTPNPEGEASCEYGWISYVPQKQERCKSGSLVVPLTKYARAALNLVSLGPHLPTDRVLGFPQSAVTFRKTWKMICEKAGVFPRKESGEDYFLIKHFRKAATSEINAHRSGLAPYIVGHAGDRSATASVVSDKHYDNQEKQVLECLMTMPVPECFQSLLND